MILFITTLLILILGALCVYDFMEFRLPDTLNICLAALGIFQSLYLDSSNFFDSILGSFLAGGSLYIVREAYYWYRGTQGLGLGDVKLAAAGGLWVEWQGVGLVILTASITAIIAVLAYYRSFDEQSFRSPFPFGPFLACGIFSTWTYQVWTFYVA